MKLYYPITIDLYKVYPLQVMEAQQGNVGRGSIVTLTAGGAVVDPTNEDVEVYAKRPDGTVSWLECSVEDAKVKIDFTNQMLMSPGVLQVELRIKNETDDITTPIFMVQVNKSNVQNAGRSENELPLLDQIKKNADDAKAAAEAAEKAVGDKITNPNVGAVGQILAVETVDEKGKPLTYKAVDKPEGGEDKELSQIIHASKYGIVSDGVNDTVIAVGKDAAAGDVIRYIITENSGDITVIYDNGDTGEFNISSISHAGEEAGEKTLTAEKYCTYTFPSEIEVYLPFNIPSKISQLADDVGVAKQHEVSKLSEDIVVVENELYEFTGNNVYDNFIKGYYYVLTGDKVDFDNPVKDSTLFCTIIDCSANDVFTISGSGGNSGRLWGFTDDTGTVLKKSNSNITVNNLTITAPENATKLVVNFKHELGKLYKNILLVDRVKQIESFKLSPYNLFEYGGIRQDGTVYDSYSRIRTKDYLPDCVDVVRTGIRGTFLRSYENDVFTEPQVFTGASETIDIKHYRELYPTYKFKIIVQTESFPEIVDTFTFECSNNYQFINDILNHESYDILNHEARITEIENNLVHTMFYPYKFKPQAHRGLSSIYTQNTLIAFEESAKLPYIYGIETDVQQTSDGVLVCYHDDTLDTLTTGSGTISIHTFEELQTFTYKEKTDKIPKLEDYLKICRKYGKVPYIELKSLTTSGIDDVLSLVQKSGFFNRCVFTSFAIDNIAYIRSKTNDYLVEFMYSSTTNYEEIINVVKNYKNAVARLNANVITEEIVNQFHENGLLVDCWGLDIDDIATYETLINSGVEGCTCNDFGGYITN